uniref:transposase n=1 Tax=Candidatus Regiella insecticola TaxID=138073 RepID=UPI00387E3848
MSKTLLQQLKEKGVTLITRVRRNMKPVEHSEFDKAILRKRSLIETVFDQLKNMCQIEHTRHRSPQNFIVNLLGGIVAYCLTPSKPKLALHSSNIVSL